MTTASRLGSNAGTPADVSGAADREGLKALIVAIAPLAIPGFDAGSLHETLCVTSDGTFAQHFFNHIGHVSCAIDRYTDVSRHSR
jgi:hypothetical protein